MGPWKNFLFICTIARLMEGMRVSCIVVVELVVLRESHRLIYKLQVPFCWPNFVRSRAYFLCQLGLNRPYLSIHANQP